MLATKSPYTANIAASTQPIPPRTFSEGTQRTQISSMALQDGLFSSPTNSEFSDAYEGLDSIRAWDEGKVVEWLHSIRCGQYETLFKANNFTGESLLECDQKILSEMGIKKIGDRVRINVAIKQLRNKSSLLRTRRNRDSLAVLDGLAGTPSSSDSPRTHGSRSHPGSGKRFSRQLDPSVLQNFNSASTGFKVGSQPSSPLADVHSAGLRAHRYAGSPMDNGRATQAPGYFSQPGSANSTSGKRPETGQVANQPARATHLRQNSSMPMGSEM